MLGFEVRANTRGDGSEGAEVGASSQQMMRRGLMKPPAFYAPAAAGGLLKKNHTFPLLNKLHPDSRIGTGLAHVLPFCAIDLQERKAPFFPPLTKGGGKGG